MLVDYSSSSEEEDSPFVVSKLSEDIKGAGVKREPCLGKDRSKEKKEPDTSDIQNKNDESDYVSHVSTMNSENKLHYNNNNWHASWRENRHGNPVVQEKYNYKSFIQSTPSCVVVEDTGDYAASADSELDINIYIAGNGTNRSTAKRLITFVPAKYSNNAREVTANDQPRLTNPNPTNHMTFVSAKEDGDKAISPSTESKSKSNSKHHSTSDTSSNVTDKDSYYCDVCHVYMDHEYYRQVHRTSTTHQFNRIKLQNECSGGESSSSKIGNYSHVSDKAYNLLKASGWDGTSGLGSNQQGRLYPVTVDFKDNRYGIGSKLQDKNKGKGVGDSRHRSSPIGKMKSNSKVVAAYVSVHGGQQSLTRAQRKRLDKEQRMKDIQDEVRIRNYFK